LDVYGHITYIKACICKRDWTSRVPLSRSAKFSIRYRNDKKLIYRWQTARRMCAMCNSVADLQNTTLHHVTTPNLVVLRQRVWA